MGKIQLTGTGSAVVLAKSRTAVGVETGKGSYATISKKTSPLYQGQPSNTFVGRALVVRSVLR